ncbi:hypothetical protein GVN21_19290 [Caulobacter sp. SLTY]|uniref:hypothetical protein n=1 Tax=Caulobacter sp. SLTY TaxID=2683262 RepID=UPI0014135C9D|nr:hypothetical protein [Caulobacter sp. SLTY]NBB17511.1 hypothetical protein [Caulobacter sp. SLTY]
MTKWGAITEEEALEKLREALSPLCGTPVDYLRLPADMALQMEPSQIGTIVGTLTDLMLPRIALAKGIGLTKAAGLLGEREGYPDFVHDAGYRLELKGAFTDNPAVEMKRPPTPREPSARLTQKVTVKNVQADADGLLLLVYRLEPLTSDKSVLSPTITAVGVFPVIHCVLARDSRMLDAGGRWFGNYETPTILSKIGRSVKKRGDILNTALYGRKESEGHHFNEDTNFGKLKRIPYRPLQEFLRDSGCQFSPAGNYPKPWSMSKEDRQLANALDVAGQNVAEG